MRVSIITDKTPEQELYALAEIITKLRYHSAKWHQHFGYENRNRMNYWAAKADQWIDQHVKEQK